jgi:hypothetical protein
MTILEQKNAYEREENGGYKKRKTMETLVD